MATKKAVKTAKTQREKEQAVAKQEAIAKKADEVLGTPVTEVEVKSEDIEVNDPLDLRPKKLPLVVKPKGGKWKNKNQEFYAGIVNAYAYKNPTKWIQNQIVAETGKEIPNSAKKDILVKRLAEIGENPEALYKYYFVDKRLTYTNKLMED